MPPSDQKFRPVHRSLINSQRKYRYRVITTATTLELTTMAPTENSADKMDALYPDQEAIPVKVHVLAPATLPAGYTFEASVNGDPERTFTAEVVCALNIVVV